MGLIVCATRGGEAGRRTQEQAIALAKERDEELVFLCIFDPAFAGNLSDALSEAVLQEQQQSVCGSSDVPVWDEQAGSAIVDGVDRCIGCGADAR